ncbi:MAG: hypothetical protein ACREOH_06975 [Candidatus Entotheonellia bacterium]
MPCSRAHEGRFSTEQPPSVLRGGGNQAELSPAEEEVSTGYGTVGGFPKQLTPRGTPADRLTWGR